MGAEGGTGGPRYAVGHNGCVGGGGDVPEVQAAPVHAGDQVVVPGTPAGINISPWA